MNVEDKIDDKLIEPFISATLNVLRTMAFTEAHTDGPYMKNEKKAKGDVSGVIGITGDFNGSLSVSFPEKSILTIVSNMFGEEMSEVDDEIRDAVGEITNMISGQARQKLDEIGRSLKAAIPSVILGKNHKITHISKHPVITIPFHTQEGEFTIEVCFEK